MAKRVTEQEVIQAALAFLRDSCDEAGQTFEEVVGLGDGSDETEEAILTIITHLTRKTEE